MSGARQAKQPGFNKVKRPENKQTITSQRAMGQYRQGSSLISERLVSWTLLENWSGGGSADVFAEGARGPAAAPPFAR